ncbi:DUF4407 domain-containing protein [Chitinophaga lutea]
MTTTPPAKQQPDGFSRFLWWLATADAEILQECKTDRERYRIIGMAVLVTALFATLAWGYFFSTVVQDDLLTGGLALFFGFAILTIDRSLIAAMTRQGGQLSFWPVAFRLAVAVTIGLFISQPVVMMLFKKDIDAQMVLDRQDKMEQFRKEQIAYNAALTRPLETELTGMDRQLALKEELVKEYKDGYIRETDGTGGSGKIGESAIARVKKGEYLKAEEELRTLRKQLAPEREERQIRLAEYRAADSLKEQAYLSTLQDGFLAQTEALHRLTDTHPPLRQRYRLIVFIITLIEIMPLLTKLLMPKGEYEEKLAAMAVQRRQAGELAEEKEKELQEHYHAGAAVADKEVMDHLFELTAPQRRKEAERLVDDWRETDGRSFHKLWASARRLLLLHKP